jgi:ABC-type lipoprotein release transport system permease subunit
MNLRHLITREISHRKGNFAISVLGVAMAVATIAATMCLLTSHQMATTKEMAALEDSIRKSMKGLGFNIFIFPEGQEMSEVYSEGFASKTMPEEYVTKLANSTIVTVNHLLPSLTQKVDWEEQNRTAILVGIRGEVPIAHRDLKKPLIAPVRKGELVLGYELHRGAGIQAGDKLQFRGREFTVAKTHASRGSKDDITMWMNLGEAQEMLEKAGQINAIQALECNCATVDRLGEIRAELMKILPDTQIIETESTALARAEARNTAGKTARQSIDETERFASLLLPIVTLAGMAWIGLLALSNVRERVSEIGILRAMGVKGQKIFAAFLSRAALAGFGGALIGLTGLVILFPLLSGKYFHDLALSELMKPAEWILPLFATPLLAIAAAWLPAMVAAQKDPADVLRQD